MAEFEVSGPIRKKSDYTPENKPIIQASDVSGVAYINNMAYENGDLNIPYKDTDGNPQTKSVPINVNASIVIRKGLCASEAIANSDVETAKTLALAALPNAVQARVNNPNNGFLVSFTTPTENPKTYRRPYIALPLVFETHLHFFFNLDENVTSYWAKAGESTIDAVPHSLWVSSIPFQSNFTFSYLVRNFL